jgi:hypothetical protein
MNDAGFPLKFIPTCRGGNDGFLFRIPKSAFRI